MEVFTRIVFWILKIILSVIAIPASIGVFVAIMVRTFLITMAHIGGMEVPK